MRTAGQARPIRVALAASAGLFLAAAFGAPAAAHVEVSADKPQAGARDVTITFISEGESGSAGIRAARVVLPTGIAPSDVRLAKAPKGWRLTPGTDGFTVAGPALRPRQDAVFAITVAQLPVNATQLAFRTLDTYSDGQVARWIEIPQAGQAEPDNPAPVLKLKPAAAASTPNASATPSSSAATPGASASVTGPAAVTSAPAASASPVAADGGGSGGGWWLALAAVVLTAAAATVALILRRRNAE